MILSGKEVIKMFDEKSNVEKNQDEIRIINKWQVVFYLKHGVAPTRLELGYDDRLVFVYRAEETKEVWQEWKRYTVQRKLETLKETLNLYNVGVCNLEDYDYDYFFNE